jgi:hypothetical protein
VAKEGGRIRSVTVAEGPEIDAHEPAHDADLPAPAQVSHCFHGHVCVCVCVCLSVHARFVCVCMRMCRCTLGYIYHYRKYRKYILEYMKEYYINNKDRI